MSINRDDSFTITILESGHRTVNDRAHEACNALPESMRLLPVVIHIIDDNGAVRYWTSLRCAASRPARLAWCRVTGRSTWVDDRVNGRV
jgi:hypothetical protein